MAHDEELAERIRGILAPHAPDERRMFGGIAFMVRGHMTVGVTADNLMVASALTPTRKPSSSRTPVLWTSPAAR